MVAITPFSVINANNAYDIMIKETCRLSQGDRSTGINGVIWGFICPMLDTNKEKPESKKPKAVINGNLVLNIKAMKRMHHATKSIVS